MYDLKEINKDYWKTKKSVCVCVCVCVKREEEKENT